MIVVVILGTVGFFGFGATVHFQTRTWTHSRAGTESSRSNLADPSVLRLERSSAYVRLGKYVSIEA